MAFKLFDRVQETTATTGTGTISMGGAVTGYRAFSSVFTTGDTTHYVLSDGTNWEVGLGTLTTGTPWTLARTTILASSNAGAAVSFPGPTTNVWCDVAAQQASVAPTFSGQITSTLATGTAPFSVASTTPVANLAIGGNAATATTATAVANAATFNSAGAGAASGSTWNGNAAITISYNTVGAVPLNGALGTPTSGTLTNCTFPTLNQSTTGSAGSVANALTFNNGGAGAASGTTYNGAAAQTISYNTIGASPLAGSSSLTTVASSLALPGNPNISGGSGALRIGGSIIRFESATQACPAGNAAQSVAHGGPRKPDFARAVLRCAIANAGYAVGDEIDITGYTSAADSANDRNVNVWSNATNVGATFTSTGTNAPTVVNKASGGGITTVTAADWNVVYYCLWF